MKLKTNWYDLREFLAFLDEQGQVDHIKEEIDPAWEVNYITRSVSQKLGPCLMFENIKDMDYPMVAGLLAEDKRFLWSLGLDNWNQYNNEWALRTKKMLPPVKVETGPIKEEVIEGNDIDLNKICNVIWHIKDKAAFPGTLLISITKDPETNVQNMGIYRMGIQDKNRMCWGAPPSTHGGIHFQQWERLGKPMPMALVCGGDPTIEIAGGIGTAPGIDELDIVGALRGEPVPVVKCETIDMYVPATAEMVIEGHIYPGDRELEVTEWFGEYTGYYGEASNLPVFVAEHITHRKDPIFVGTREQWYPSESHYVVGRTHQAEAFKLLRNLVPGVLDMRCNPAYEAVVKIDKMFKGHPQKVMNTLWGISRGPYKHIIVVDKDVDIWDYEAVHWAMSTRVKADRDVLIVPRIQGQWLDPSVPFSGRQYSAGLGIDATMPVEEYNRCGNRIPTLVDDLDIMEKGKAKFGDRF